ncbi:MAG: type I DNA topoisomerase, partial [Candidatus Hydrogenedentales bacterium]
MKLVIVESPAKAKTIEKFLPKGYRVTASYGHIRDLPGSAEETPEEIKKQPWAQLAVNVDSKYEPVYIIPKSSQKRINELKRQLKEADELILATDEDREGESISWHLLEVLKPKVPVKRIAFHEITKSAILEALENYRQVDTKLKDAQESRRILDRIYGYSLSPVLWRKVRPKLSAGRVQSVAVRLVVEREEERKAFRTAEYWDVVATLAKEELEFTATLVALGERRIAASRDFDPSTGQLLVETQQKGEVVWIQAAQATQLAEELGRNGEWRTARVEQKEATLRPDGPFITSSLQRAASGLLGFSPNRTMRIAQDLYEGVDLGGGEREGLITYMRTDSTALSEQALKQAAVVIRKRFGEKYHQWRTYTTKSKMAQEAHEAIRPTHLDRHPDEVASFLTDDQLKLYRLVWNRTLASQMTDAKLKKTTVEFEVETEQGTAVLRANGSVVTFPGFLKVSDTKQKDTQLPEIEQGERVIAPGKIAGPADAVILTTHPHNALVLQETVPVKHETKPPARYTEASLIQRLEEEGIGRPSTYAPTIGTIQQRGYVELKGKALVPTFLAVAVTQLLKKHFGEYIDYDFTARMEDALDAIARGEQDPTQFLRGFHRGDGQFGQGLEPQIERELPNIDFPVLDLGQDPKSGQRLVVRIGRTAPYIQRGEGGDNNIAPIPQDALYEEVSAEKAVELLNAKAQGNEAIGSDPGTGLPVFALIGPYGPYVQLGEKSDENKKPKRASLPKGMQPADVDMPFALKLLSLPRTLGQYPNGGDVIAGIGRFGPYVKYGEEFRSLEASDDVYA